MSATEEVSEAAKQPEPSVAVLSKRPAQTEATEEVAQPETKRKKRRQPKPTRERARKNQLQGSKVDAGFLNETLPYLEDGFRKIPPYFYTFNCYAKGRWLGRTIYDVFATEFQAESPAYYKDAIETGLITVDDQKVLLTHVVGNNQVIVNKVHRHEPPVTTQPLAILFETDDYLVVDKPSSIPVHPCGRYRHNTVQALLGHEQQRWGLYPCHRLDRLTSGLLIFAKNGATAKQMEVKIREHQVQKTYICRVEGQFPADLVDCAEPIKIVDQRIGLCCVHPEGKPCRTRFELVRVDGDTSVVKCFPESGRMHQIRVHTQYLGYPIANDPIYNSTVFGDSKGKGFRGAAPEVARIAETMCARIRASGEQQQQADVGGDELAIRAAAESEASSVATVEVEAALEPMAKGVMEHPRAAELPEAARTLYWPACTECQLVREDPRPEAMRIYLHAYRYTGGDFDFETDMPWWSQADWAAQLAARGETY